jgi:hypothetical protein
MCPLLSPVPRSRVQESNVVPMTVQAPTVDIVDVYDTLQMSDADKLVDPCLTAVTDNKTETVLVVEGANFGGDASLCTITLVSLDGSDTQACNVCYIDRTKQSLARCITSAGRDKAFDLTVQVVDQVSSSVLYDYRILVQVRWHRGLGWVDGCT